MSRKQDGSQVLPFTDKPLGVRGGGWVSGIKQPTTDGYIVCRDDTSLAYLRRPGGAKFETLFRFGDNLPIGEHAWRVRAGSRCYDIDICQTNSNRIVGVTSGRIQKSADRGASFQRVMSYKGGVVDTALYTEQNGRIGCGQVMIDPFNPDVWGLGHTVDGFYYTENDGAAVAQHPGVPPPINPADYKPGIRFAFDRQSLSGGKCQRIALAVPGRTGVYKFAAGLSSTPDLIAGTNAPTGATSIVISNNRIVCCGNGSPGGSHLYIHDGTNWSVDTQRDDVNAVCVDINNPSRFLAMTIGGAQLESLDGGISWTVYNFVTVQDGGNDQPWIETSDHTYMSTGAITLDRSLGAHRLLIAHGLGVSEFVNPPRTALAQKYKTMANGILNILLMGGSVNPLGTAVIGAQDRPFYRFGREDVGNPVRRTYPAPGGGAIRHADDADWAIDDPNWWAAPYLSKTETLLISTDDFRTQQKIEVPFTYPLQPGQDVPDKYAAGQIAVTLKGKFVWSASSHGAPVGYDAGEWFTPVFRHTTGGAPVDMTGARNHVAYWLRKKVVVADKENPGVIWWLVTPATDNLSGALETAQAGLYRSSDHGRNFIRVKAGSIIGHGVDYFGGKLRLVPGFMLTDMFFAGGNVGADSDSGVNGGGVVFCNNANAASPTFTTLPGFREPEDVGFSINPTSHPYPRITIAGHKEVAGEPVYGRWVSDNFNRLNPTAATWTRMAYPEGRNPGGCMLISNMARFPGLITIVPGGEGYIEDDPVRLLMI